MCTVVDLLYQGGHDDVVVVQVKICDGKVLCDTAIETFKRGMACDHGIAAKSFCSVYWIVRKECC
jgi:hypothetical protein